MTISLQQAIEASTEITVDGVDFSINVTRNAADDGFIIYDRKSFRERVIFLDKHASNIQIVDGDTTVPDYYGRSRTVSFMVNRPLTMADLEKK